MCIIVAKPSGKKLPSQTILRNCFWANDDGAGYMFNKNGKVVFKKGFMDFNSFYKSLRKDYLFNNGKKNTFVMHFRIGTQGANSPELTHPYSISKDIKELQLLKGKTDMCLCHNGIISLTSGGKERDRNDTMKFITDYLALFIKNKEDVADEDKQALITKLIGYGNKLAILTPNKLTLLGSFCEEDGIYYSNYSYLGHYGTTTTKETSKKDEITTCSNEKNSMEDYYEEFYSRFDDEYDFFSGECPYFYEGRYDYCDFCKCREDCDIWKDVENARAEKFEKGDDSIIDNQIAMEIKKEEDI